MNFDADHPIERRDQDRLERREFAESIADQIISIPAERGFTIAISGQWGSGKTSVINLVAETIENAGTRTVLLRFNPWLFSGPEELVVRFFRELGAQIGQKDYSKLKKVVSELSGFGRALSPLSPVPGTSVAANTVSWIARQLSRPKSLLEQRKSLREALSKSESKIFVIVDDIDRLEPTETRELMRLIRVMSDLPNVIFLLAFDRDRVAKSLDDVDPAEGHNYLEKIVQQTYDIPSIRQDILQRIFLDSLNELVVQRKPGPLDPLVWPRVFYEIIKPLLRNLRDVKRYLHSLPVTLDMIKDEVALADILGLEAIRILRPKMFENLRSNAEYLVNSRATLRPDMVEQGTLSMVGEALQRMLEDAGADSKVLRSVIEILFPAARGFLVGRWESAPQDGTLRAQRRVGSEEVLRIYMQAGLDEGTIPSREIEELVESLTDEDKLTTLLETVDEPRLEVMLERLGDYGRDLPEEAVSTAVPVLINQFARLSRDRDSMSAIPPRSKANLIVIRLLRTIEEPTRLEPAMDAMLSKVKSLSGRYLLLGQVGHREQVERQLISRQQSIEIEEVLKAQLEAASAEQLAAEPDLAEMALRAMHWLDGSEKARLAARLREHLASDEFVMNLLRTSVNTAFLSGQPERRLFWKELVEDYGDEFPDAVRRLIRSQEGLELSDENREALDLAQKYLNGWRPEDF